MTVAMRERMAPVFYPSETELTVRFADVDMMKVVHHSVYIHWFEQIRFTFLRRVMEIEPRQLFSARLAFPVIECHAKYRRAVQFEQQVVGYCHVELHPNALFTFHYQIFERDGQKSLYATGSTVHCYVTNELELLLKPPELMRDGFTRTKARFPAAIVQSNGI